MNKTDALLKQIDFCNKGISLAEGIEKLNNNVQFKKVILTGYFEEEAVRLVSLLSDHNMQGDENQQLVTNAMRGIGELRSWLGAMTQRAEQFKKMKLDYEQELEHLGNSPEADNE